MHSKITVYQEKVLLNAFDGKVISQILGPGGKLEEEWYMYPVKDKKYSLPASRYYCHTINKFAFKKLLSEGFLEPEGIGRFIISRKGMEKVLGHDNFSVERL